MLAKILNVGGAILQKDMAADAVFETGEAQRHVRNSTGLQPGGCIRNDLLVPATKDEAVGDDADVGAGVGKLLHGFDSTGDKRHRRVEALLHRQAVTGEVIRGGLKAPPGARGVLELRVGQIGRILA